MILGITGTNGAGKGTVVDYLVTKGFTRYSVREFLVTEIERRGMPLDRSSMREIANGIRKEQGASSIIEGFFKQAQAHGGDAVIESVRNIGEATFLKSHGALLLAIDADQAIRYDRIVKRASGTDHIDFDTWVAQEKREWYNTSEYDMDVPGVMAMADETVNSDQGVESLYAGVDAFLARVKK